MHTVELIADIDVNNVITSFKIMKNGQESGSKTTIQQPNKPWYLNLIKNKQKSVW